MAASLIVPKFGTEDEEADWWDQNRDLVEQKFLAAAEEGTLQRGSLLRKVTESKRMMEASVDLDESDAKLAHAAAARKGMQFQAYVKMLVHEALKKEANAA